MDFKPQSYNYSTELSNIPTSSKHQSLPRCCCTRHCHLEAQRRKQAPFHCWGRGTVQTYHRTVQYNMCASHLVCMLTVISIGAHTVFPGLNLLFGTAKFGSGFQLYIRGVPCPLPASLLLPGLNQMASGRQRHRGRVELCTVSDAVAQTWVRGAIQLDEQPREANTQSSCTWIYIRCFSVYLLLSTSLMKIRSNVLCSLI